MANSKARPRTTDTLLTTLRHVPLRTYLFYGAGALYMMWCASRAFEDFGRLADAASLPFMPLVLLAGVWRDLCGLAAGLIFGIATLNAFRWLNGKRLVIGTIAFSMMLGAIGTSIMDRFAMLVFQSMGAQGFGTALHVAPNLQGMALAILLVATPLVMWVWGFFAILVVFVALGTAFSFLVGVPMMLFNQIFQFEKELKVYRHSANGLGGYISRFFLWIYNVSLPADERVDDTRGARFATRREMLALHNAANAKPHFMAFGHWIEEKSPFILNTEKHVLVMASTRSGKGVSLIIPHLLRYPGSAFVLDPKGENAKATARARANLNDRVHFLDPFGITGLPQSRFNPLSRFTAENMEAESRALAAAMFVVSARGRDHWSDSGQQLLAAFILYVYASPDIPRTRKDLPTVRRLLLGRTEKTLEDMIKTDIADGMLANLANSFLETPQNELGSIISTAQRQTEILDNPYLQACLAADGAGPEIDFNDWRRGTMSVFLCLSAPKFPTFNRWLRLVLTSALDTMTETLNPPREPVCFALDELATLGHLQVVENAIGLAAGYGIQIVSVFQDVAQMRDLYQGRWASFVGNAGVRALFSLDDYETADYWSKFLGGRLVETHSHSEDLYGYSKGENIGEAMRPLLTAEQLMLQFASDKILVLAQGQHPIMTARVPYFQDASLVGRWDDPRSSKPIPLPPPRQSGPKPSAPPHSAPAASLPRSPEQTARPTPERLASSSRPTTHNWTSGSPGYEVRVNGATNQAAPVKNGQNVPPHILAQREDMARRAAARMGGGEPSSGTHHADDQGRER
jgi:type IV secretion system protein VirD4